MHIFYTTSISGNSALLGEEESLHLSKVLRLKSGDSVQLIDGIGGYFQGIVLQVHPKHTSITDLIVLPVLSKRPYKLHVAMAPTKMMERFEWFLEKAVEIGIDEITPIITKRTERDQVKMARMEKIVLAAMKQSITPWMPKLNEAIGLSAFLKKQLPENRFIAHCEDLDKRYLTNVSLGSEDLLVLVGPEGDFTMEEIEKCIDNGFQGISLGESRLRAETAAVVVCAQVQAAWQMKA
jgi:16S rRNA (uracil1498-N3)-methyltransferase